MARIERTGYRIWQDDALWFDGVLAGERNNIYGTSGDDRLTGTSGGDNFQAYQGGVDTLRGGAGDDKFFLKAPIQMKTLYSEVTEAIELF